MLEIIDKKVLKIIGERPKKISKQDMKYILKVKDPITGEILKEHIIDYKTYVIYKNNKNYEIEISPESLKQQEEIEKQQEQYDQKYKKIYEKLEKEMHIDEKMKRNIQRIIETINDWIDIYDYKEDDTSLKKELEEVIIEVINSYQK